MNNDKNLNGPNKVRFALVLLCETSEADTIIDLINQHTRAFVVYRKMDSRPLWISTQPPPRESGGGLP